MLTTDITCADEFKSLEDLENAGYSVLRLDNGKFVTDYL